MPVIKSICYLIIVISIIWEISVFAKSEINQPKDFFKTPPKAERAILSAYENPSLKGKYGVRIETEPLEFLTLDTPRQLEPDILLEYISLPSLDPTKLANQRFKPGSDYDGSFYFLAEHNRVELKEIRFLNASGNSIETEYDLVIHLPRSEANEYPITLKTKTEIKAAPPKLEPPRTVEGLGKLTQEKENFWKGNGTYGGHPIEIEFYSEPSSFLEMTKFVRDVVSGQKFTRTIMNREISKELKYLEWKLKEFNAPLDIKAEEFQPLSFYFIKHRHHPEPETIVVLSHPRVSGHWSITFSAPDRSNMDWIPKTKDK